MCKISVVIPVYNSENTIYRCLKSVLKQTYKDFEIIIVNDGSTDNSLKIINSVLRDCEQHYKIMNKKNEGVSVARNLGINISSGEYIAFLDSDDIWVSNKLERQIAIMEIKKLLFLATLNCNNNVKENHLDEYSLKRLLFSNSICTSSVMVKKDVLMRFGGFNENLSYSEDYNLWLKIAARYDVYLLKEYLTIYNKDSKTGLSSKLWKMEKGELYNYVELYRTHHISLVLFLVATIFSFGKFVKRIIVQNIK